MPLNTAEYVHFDLSLSNLIKKFTILKHGFWIVRVWRRVKTMFNTFHCITSVYATSGYEPRTAKRKSGVQLYPYVFAMLRNMINLGGIVYAEILTATWRVVIYKPSLRYFWELKNGNNNNNNVLQKITYFGS